MVKLAALAALPLAATLAVANTSLLVVDVKQGGPNGHRIVLPVPLFIAQAALSFAPEKAARIQIPEEAAKHMQEASGILDALVDCPDAELVRVEERDQTVVIAKQGNLLKIDVTGRKQNVHVNLPIAAVRDFVKSHASGEIRASELVSALKQVVNTDLVDVQDGDDHVRVYVW